MKNLLLLLSTVFIVTLITVGCDTTSSGMDEPAGVQLQMQANTGNATAKQTQNQEGIVIQEVKIFIEEMEIESIQNDSLDFEVENFIAILPLDESPLVLTEQEIPAGIYDEFELGIEKPDDDDDDNVQVNDSDFRDETGSYSIVVKGLYNSEEFMFRSSEDFEIEVDLNPSLEIGEGENSTLVISVDVSSWFKGSNGEDLDPKDPDNTERINENIENSFEGFEDQFDEDNDDDDDDE